MNNVFILGGAQTDFSRNWTKEGKSFAGIFREALVDGLAAADLSYEEVRRLNSKNRIAGFVGNFDAEQYCNQGHLGAFFTEIDKCFYGMPAARYEAACASSSVAIDAAMAKIRCGDYDVAIVLGIEAMKTVDSKTGGDFLGTAAYYEKEAKGIDFPFPKLFGKLADDLLLRHKGTKEEFLEALTNISCINYENGKRNENAQTRQWFMSTDQCNMRGIGTNGHVGGMLAVSDCSQVTDGAAVVVLCSEKYLKEISKNASDTPSIKGWGHRVAPLQYDKKIKESKDEKYILKWTRQAVKDAYDRADLGVDDMDFFETHDCFTSSEYAAVSAFGITEPGEEYIAINSGRISFNGDKPINPSGGLIGCGHPVGASGARMLLDLYKQVNGSAQGYQIEGAKNGMMMNIGGSATTCYVFIVGK